MFNIFSFFKPSNTAETAHSIKQLDELAKIQEEELAARRQEIHRTSKEFEATVKEFLDDREYRTSKSNG